MIIWIILAIVLALLAYFGAQRARIPRETGIESIEDAAEAHAYDRISRWPQFEQLRRMILRQLARYHPQGTIVDIGCGPGYLTAMMARRFPAARLIGIDISEEMVAKAKANLASAGLDNRVEFRLSDAATLPLPDSSADFVVSTLSLHHWSDPAEVVKEIHRVLAPSGQFFVFDIRRDSRRWFYWLACFTQRFIVPEAMRHSDEPTRSIRSAYSLKEAGTLAAAAPFAKTDAFGSFGFIFIWGQK